MRPTKRVAVLGLMLAIILVMTALEHALPPLPLLPLLPPNVKLGLSNIVTMYAVYFVGKSAGASLNALKAFFVFLTRGPVAGALSFCGGMLSILVIILLVALFKAKISLAVVSVFGAVAHNLGQLAAITLIMNNTPGLAYFLPALLVSGVVMGLVTGTLLKVIIPVFRDVLKE